MKTNTVLLVLASVSLAGCLGVAGVNAILYNREVEGYLKQAADANTIELAEEKLAQAIEGMDARGLCNADNPEEPVFGKDCYTSVLWRTPDEDVGYWRTNIQATYDDLHNTTAEERADNLTESNQLMKVRETLLDDSSGGTSVTAPPGISLYPANTQMFWWALLSGLGLVGGAVWWFIDDHNSW